MEKEQDPRNELQRVGPQAADALRGYGYPDLAGEYECTLHRSTLDPQAMLAHSRIANTALKELNNLAEVKQGRHPALQRTIQLQERLEAALPSNQQAEAARSTADRSLPTKSTLKENSESLGTAAQEVANYLREKRGYSQASITELEEKLGTELTTYRSSPNVQTLEKLETHTREGMAVMKADFGAAKEAMQKENEEYVRERNYLSEEGKEFILKESERGEFLLPNGQKGHSMESRITFTQQQLEQYASIKDQIISSDRQQNGQLPIKQALSNTTEHPEVGASTIDSQRSSLEQNYPHLSSEQQDRYVSLQTSVQEKQTTINKEQEIG
uniref:Uncharacterized protein n=1 Tax=Roseihalotalea indica TaxID=2867963 RepID=A0AA49JHR2_9BACT|nr:hypothetical protein K4G66_08340 [Tunicatimonas sp. TK19036]